MSQRMLQRANAYERKLGRTLLAMERKGVIDNIQVDCKYVPKANCAYSQSWFDYKGVRYRLDHSWGCHSPKLPTAGHIRELIWKDLVVIAGL